MSDEPPNPKQTPADAAALRKLAEEQARAKGPTSHPAPQPTEELRQALHELRVHQIELETQNEALRTAQAALEESRARYFDLYDRAPVGYCTLSEKGLILEANLTAASMLGVARSALVKRPFPRFILEEDQGIYYLHRKNLSETGEPQVYELRLARPDGAVFWAHLTATVALERDGAQVCRVVLIDITERKRAEEVLRTSESRLRIAVRHSAMTFAQTDRNLRYTWIHNPHPDFDPQIVLGKRDDELANNDGVRQLVAMKQQVLSTGKGVRREITFPLSTGQETYDMFAEPIFDAAANVIGVSTVSMNITERKRIEEELQKSQRLESLGVLAGGIAHDFNNLMGGIFGYIDLAIDESGRRRSSEYLSKALCAIDRARALTGQLLTFSKGGAPVKKVDYLFPFVEETARFALSGANVSCSVDVPPDLWACDFDKNQIGQVIDNLIINAQQAMPVGGTIELTARNVSLAANEHPNLTEGDYVKISVKDSGVGIPREFITRVFDPFFTTKPKGHGLGLTTCYSIISRHNGSIDVTSEPGKGSTFHVYLPSSTHSVLPSTAAPAAMHEGTGTFLVMDDEEVVRETVRAALSSFGYTAVCASCGEEALEFFTAEIQAHRKIAGMIFDLTVPGRMGGKDSVAKVRQINRDVPVFVASGYAEDPVMKNPADYGFTAGICKPFRRSDLSEMLNRYMTPRE